MNLATQPDFRDIFCSGQTVLADGQGHVAVPVRLSASRPDGRTMDGPQVVLVTVDDGRVRAIEQFVGEPAAVAAFWA